MQGNDCLKLLLCGLQREVDELALAILSEPGCRLEEQCCAPCSISLRKSRLTRASACWRGMSGLDRWTASSCPEAPRDILGTGLSASLVIEAWVVEAVIDGHASTNLN